MKLTRTQKLTAAAGSLLALLLADMLILTPALEASADLERKTEEARRQLEEGRFVLSQEAKIRARYGAHSGKSPEGSTDDTAGTFQQDLVELFGKAGIRAHDLRPARVQNHGKFAVEIIFTAGMTVSHDELIRLLEAFDRYPGYLRTNRVKVTAGKEKNKEKLDVNLEVSTIWFTPSEGGHS
jgi:hypothetical protein